MNLKRLGRYLTLSILVSLVLICSPCLASAYTYTITALVDGESDLIIQGNTVQWHNLNNEVPGVLWLDEEETQYELVPTYISSYDMDPPSEWYPWSSEGTYPADYTGEKMSIPFTELDQPLPAGEQIVSVSVIDQTPIKVGREGQGTVGIYQPPLSTNDYTLIVKFDDAEPPGAAWYTVQLEVNPVPLPGSILLLGSGLLGLLALRGRHRRF